MQSKKKKLSLLRDANDYDNVKYVFDPGDSNKSASDAERFIKFFTPGLDALPRLCDASIKLLVYIIGVLQPKKTEVYIDIEEAFEHCEWKGKSKAAYYKGLCGLIEQRFIAKKAKTYNVYYINPNMFYNGSRIPIMGMEGKN